MTENEKLEIVNGVLPPVESRNQIEADFPYAESFPELISFDQAKASVFNLISRQLFSNDKILNDSKANKSNTLSGYGITDAYSKDDTYTKEEVNTAIAEKIADVVAGAPAKFDTLREIAEWIESDTSNAAILQADVSALKTGKADVSHSHTISDLTDLAAATQSKAGLMTAADKTKLDNLPSSITGYTLPEATNSTLGGIKIGENISLSSGTISLSKANVTNALGYTPATSSHTHDDRYYTESEVDSKLSGKSDVGHTHDDRYYTEAEIDSKLSGKANSNHTHSQYLTGISKDSVVAALGYTPSASDTTYNVATQSSTGLMSASDKAKLDGIAVNANNYSLPSATSSTLGGVKVGSNISVSSGTISLSKANVTSALGFTPATEAHTHSQYLTSHNPVDSALSSTSTNAIQNKVVNAALSGKAASSHTHDDRYYTESEIDSKLSGKANLSGASFSGSVSIPTLTVTSALTIPGGKIWIA